MIELGRISDDMTKLNLTVEHIFNNYTIGDLKEYVSELRDRNEGYEDRIEELIRENVELSVRNEGRD